ncbi:hypothetical protein BG004_000906 [Podila humilis]|nr:hypothetical protein BG004_000906 [Podila humilis]
MVNLIYTARLETAFQKLESLHKEHPDDKLTEDETATIQEVRTYLTEATEATIAAVPANPELEKIMENIKSQVAEKEYQRMVSSVNHKNNNTVADYLRQDIQDLKDVKAHAIGIVNVLYTGAAVFTAVYMISAHFTNDLGMRILLAFLSFILITACEAYLYSRHASTSSTGDGFSRKKTNLKSKSKKQLPEDVVITSRTFVSTKKLS